MTEQQIDTVQEQVDLIKKYKMVFGSPQGQDVLEDLMVKTGFLEIGNLDNLKFEAGKRSVMKMIIEMVDADYEWMRDRLKNRTKKQNRRFGHESNAEIFDH